MAVIAAAALPIIRWYYITWLAWKEISYIQLDNHNVIEDNNDVSSTLILVAIGIIMISRCRHMYLHSKVSPQGGHKYHRAGLLTIQWTG